MAFLKFRGPKIPDSYFATFNLQQLCQGDTTMTLYTTESYSTFTMMTGIIENLYANF